MYFTEYDAAKDVDNEDHTMFVDQVLHLSAGWETDSDNLKITGVPDYKECYRICLITNENRCYMFR